jgi:membrane protease YdiL (CAAX protease family)
MVALTFASREGSDIVVPPSTRTPPAGRSLLFFLGSALGWSIGTIAAALTAGFLTGFIITATGLVSVIGDADKTAVFRSVGIIGSAALLFCVALASARSTGAGSMRAGLGGLRITRPIVTAAIAVVVAAYALALTLWIYRANPPLVAAMTAMNWLAFGLSTFALVIAAPFGEELFFRGWLWTGLRTHWGTLATAAATSVIWLALHAPDGLALVVLLLPLAGALTLARRFGGSVSASLAVHFAYNTAVALGPWALLWTGALTLPV